LVVEINPDRWVGLYGFAGRSSVNGYNAGQGITANFSDRTAGVGIEGQLIRLRHGRFIVGVFGQAAYYGSEVKASVPDGSGGTFEYTSDDKEPLVTIGPEFEFIFLHGMATIVARPGKDFGNTFAATTAGGFSITGDVLFDVRKGTREAVEKIGTGLRKVFRVQEPLPTI